MLLGGMVKTKVEHRLGDGAFGVYEPRPLKRRRILSLPAAILIFVGSLIVLSMFGRIAMATFAAIAESIAHAI